MAVCDAGEVLGLLHFLRRVFDVAQVYVPDRKTYTSLNMQRTDHGLDPMIHTHTITFCDVVKGTHLSCGHPALKMVCFGESCSPMLRRPCWSPEKIVLATQPEPRNCYPYRCWFLRCSQRALPDSSRTRSSQ